MNQTKRRGRLGRTMQRLRSVPGLGRDVTALAGLVAIGLAVGGYLLSNVRFDWPWQQATILTADFASAEGIAPGKGQEVRIAGVPVGDIREADVNEGGTARLTIAVETDDVVYDNARLVLRPKSPLNEMYVTIAPGGPPGEPLPDGGHIPIEQTSQPVAVDDVLAHLDDRTRAALTDMLVASDAALANAPQNLPGGLRAADDTMAALEPIVAELAERQDNLSALTTALGDVAGTVGGKDVRLAEIANSLQQTLRVLAGNDVDLEASLDQLPGLADDLRRATAGVDRLSTQLDPTLGNLQAASDELPDALAELEGTIDRIDSTLDEAGPFVHEARPVVADLRPLVADLDVAMDDLVPITAQLDPVTSGLLPYLVDVKAFMAHTASVMSISDANGGMIRGKATIAPESVPFLPEFLERPPR